MPQPPQLIRLSDLSHGTSAHLTEIRGGRHLTRRLLALGLRQGSPLCVVQRRGQGLVLASGDLRIAVGSGIAEKLWVTPAEQELDGPPCTVAEAEQTGSGAHPDVTSTEVG